MKTNSQKKPWYKRCPADWQRGTRACGMSMELRGFYSECLDVMWDLQGPLPTDDKQLALLLGCGARTVRKLMPELVALGKIALTPAGYLNVRMMADIGWPLSLGPQAATAATAGAHQTGAPGVPGGAQESANSTGTHAELDAKVPKNPANTTRDLESESESDSPNRARGGEIDFSNGVVTIPEEVAAALRAEFSGADLAEVAACAAADLVRFRSPSPVDRLAVVRKWAALRHGATAAAAARLRPTASAAPPAADAMTPERMNAIQNRIFAEQAAKAGAKMKAVRHG